MTILPKTVNNKQSRIRQPIKAVLFNRATNSPQIELEVHDDLDMDPMNYLIRSFFHPFIYNGLPKMIFSRNKTKEKLPSVYILPPPWSGSRAPSGRSGRGAAVGVGILRGAGDSFT